MSNTKKITKRDNYNALLKIEEVKNNPILKAFVEHEIELVDKKNSSRSGKPTAQQKVNNAVKESILDEMENGVEYTITDMIKQLPSCMTLTNQRTSALVRQLVKDNLVIRTEKKGRAYFSLPSEGEE
jgi:predicted transcriptional regulator